MYAHGIDILDRANDHTVVSVISHDLKFVFLPTSDGGLDQNFRNRAGLKSVGRYFFELFHGRSNSGAATTEDVGGSDHARETN